MKIFKNSTVLILILGLFINGAYGKKNPNRVSLPSLYKTSVAATGQFDGNRVRDDLENNGMIVSHRPSGHSGMEWPKDNHTYTVFASGVWLAGKVDGDIRTACAEYGPERVAGPWGSNSGDPAYKLYKVNKSDLDDPSANPDFANWPVDLGAPWVDVDGNGVYSPLPAGPDHPEFIGDQVVWYVSNDGDATEHAIFGTLPLGVEVQTTIFGFDRSDNFGDMMFVKELVINKGENTVEDLYLGLWSDPDLGDAGDDFVACDTTLGMGICYNDGLDTDYAGFSNGIPAVGYDFFQGPMVVSEGDTALMYGKTHPGYKNLKMSSFSKYINTSDPNWSDPNDAEEVYNLMQGLKKDGTPAVNSATGEETKFFYPDDPSLNTGSDDAIWADSDDHASGDRRFLMNTGPFTMAPGDSQEVVFGIFMAAAGGPLQSVNFLKKVDSKAQFAYDNNFVLPDPPPAPDVTVTALAEEIILSWEGSAEGYKVEDQINPATGEKTFLEFEGYNVYQFETLSGTGARKRIATYDIENFVMGIKDDVFDPGVGEIINKTVQFGSDTGIKRSLRITGDALNNNIPIKTNREYYFAVTAYGYNEFGLPKTLESSTKVFAVRPEVPTTWVGNDSVDYGDRYKFTHSEGNSDGFVEVTVVDPLALTGHDYEVFINKQHYYLDVDGQWKFTNYPDSVGRVQSKILDCTGSEITGAAIVSKTVGTVDLTFTFDMSCGDNWVDGIVLDLPDDLSINSWGAVGDCSYPESGQNCVNMTGTLDEATNTITWGDDARSEFGAIEGDQVWVVNVSPPASYPFDVSYKVHDDGYDGTIVDAEATLSITELGYEFKTFQHWNLKDVTTGEVVLEDQTMEGGVKYENIVDGVYQSTSYTHSGYDANPIVDGMLVALTGAPNDWKWIGVTHNAAGPVDPVELGTAYWYGWERWNPTGDWSFAQQSETSAIWFIAIHPGYGTPTADQWLASGFAYAGGNGSPNQGIGSLVPDDFEFRFTGEGKGIDYWESGDIWDIPFEVWNVGVPNDASDDYKCVVYILDDDASGDFGLKYGAGADHAVSSKSNDPYTDRIYIMAPTDDTPGTQGFDNFMAGYAAGSAPPGWYYAPGDKDPGGPMDAWAVMHRTVFVSWNGGEAEAATDRSGYVSELPETGTIFYLATTKPNTISDKFTFSGSFLKGDKVAYDVSGVKVWPNPYFGYNPEERNPVDQQMHFTHLPETGDYNIRIFDLAGTHVKTIKGSDVGTQFAVWDLRNDFGIPVASGMYLAHVEYSGKSTVLKLAVVQPEQRLDRY